MPEEKVPPPTPQEQALGEQVALGERSEQASIYLGDYIFAEIWSVVTKLANVTDGDTNKLLSLSAEIRSVMKLAQKLQIDVISADIAREQLKQAYKKPAAPITRR